MARTTLTLSNLVHYPTFPVGSCSFWVGIIFRDSSVNLFSGSFLQGPFRFFHRSVVNTASLINITQTINRIFQLTFCL